MKRFLFYLLMILGASCKRSSKDPSVAIILPSKLQRIIADTTGNFVAKAEFEDFLFKKVLCKEMCIYDLESGTDSIELRLWVESSMVEPHELYIIKGNDNKWRAFRYLYYSRRFDSGKRIGNLWINYKGPTIDSMKAESFFPLNKGWTAYIYALQLDSLWSFPSQSELRGSFGCVDGTLYTVELADQKEV